MANLAIYNGLLQPPKSIADYNAIADEASLRGQQRQQNALDLQTGQMGLQEKQRGIQESEAFRRALQTVDPRTPQGQDVLLRAAPSVAPAFLKNIADQGHINAQTEQQKAAAAKATTENVGLLQKQFQDELATVQNPQQMARWLQAKYQHPVLGPVMQKLGPLEEGIADIPTDPQKFAEFRNLAGTGIAKAIELQTTAKRDAQTARNNLIGPDGTINQPLIDVKKQIAAAGAAKTKVEVNSGQKGYENESKLRNDFKSEGIVKDYNDMLTAHKQIKAGIASGTPIGDVATATKVMKLLDPGSVVRESELAIAMAAGGRLDRLKNFVELQIKGEKLTPTQRKEFGSLADELMEAAGQAYNQKRGEYAQFGKTYGLNESVLGAQFKSGKSAEKPQAKRVIKWSDLP
jgi:hypothetical protein